MKNNGIFIISLDFELLWGVRDHRTKNDYGENILGVKKVLPQMLSLFEKYGIHATIATVGLLFCKSKEEVKAYSPILKPSYINRVLSPYEDNYIDSLVENADPYHSASELIFQLKKSTNIEIGSHTFCHYYCQEAGQNLDEFEADLCASIKIFADNGLEITSFVFPRNQVSSDYLKICSKYGITHYRGNSMISFDKYGSFLKRVLRFTDSYVNLSGSACYDYDEIKEGSMYNIKASRFLYPYSSKLRLIEGLKLKRIKDEMTFAAKQNKIYHLWWHPHNFGQNIEENIKTLIEILNHYDHLNKEYQFSSMNMNDISIKLGED